MDVQENRCSLEERRILINLLVDQSDMQSKTPTLGFSIWFQEDSEALAHTYDSKVIFQAVEFKCVCVYCDGL